MSGARLLHIHRKAAGTVRRIQDIFLRQNVTAMSEFYQADDEIGYAVFDFPETDGRTLFFRSVSAIEGTICARLC